MRSRARKPRPLQLALTEAVLRCVHEHFGIGPRPPIKAHTSTPPATKPQTYAEKAEALAAVIYLDGRAPYEAARELDIRSWDVDTFMRSAAVAEARRRAIRRWNTDAPPLLVSRLVEELTARGWSRSEVLATLDDLAEDGRIKLEPRCGEVAIVVIDTLPVVQAKPDEMGRA